MNSKRQEELFNEFSEEQRKTLIKKRSDYATEDVLSNFIQTANITGTSPAQVALILIGIKVARLGNLISNNKTNVNESMEDSVLDLANYAFLLKCILVDNNESALVEAGIADEDDFLKNNTEIKIKKYVKCIDNTSVEGLVLGGIYEISYEDNAVYRIITDNGDSEAEFFKDRFKVIDNPNLDNLQKFKGRLDKR